MGSFAAVFIYRFLPDFCSQGKNLEEIEGGECEGDRPSRKSFPPLMVLLYQEQEPTMEDNIIKARVQEQFGPSAQSYVTSQVHAHGDDLELMVELAQLRGDERVLDIATGGGHTALAFAQRA